MIKKWKPLKSDKPKLNFSGHEGSINDMVIIDKKTLASGSSDKTVKLWEIKTGWCLMSLEGHTRPITKLLYLKE